MRISKIHIIGIIVAIITLGLDFFLWYGEKIFYFVLGIAAIVGVLPFLLTVIASSEKDKEKEDMFLEFARNLVESVKAGTPISSSILNVRGKDYGSLTPHIEKLANQIGLGIPVKESMQTFAYDVGNRTITRAVTLISEAEQAGGEIETILESVARSVSQTEKLRKERKAAISTLVVQGYIIFLIFIVIMLVMEFKILPMTASLNFGGGSSGLGDIGIGLPVGGSTNFTPEQMSQPFLYLLLVQGFFAGLVIGKLAEGSIKMGFKHSFILIIMAYLISTGARAFLA